MAAQAIRISVNGLSVPACLLYLQCQHIVSTALTDAQHQAACLSQDVFDEPFWGGLDLVVNALDNVAARLYVDSRCVYFGRPLLESGTLGAKANTQVVVPSITENYGAPHGS